MPQRWDLPWRSAAHHGGRHSDPQRLLRKASLPAMVRAASGGMAERFKAHAWKACWGQLLAGSNPAPSANHHPRIAVLSSLFGGRMSRRNAVPVVAFASRRWRSAAQMLFGPTSKKTRRLSCVAMGVAFVLLPSIVRVAAQQPRAVPPAPSSSPGAPTRSELDRFVAGVGPLCLKAPARGVHRQGLRLRRHGPRWPDLARRGQGREPAGHRLDPRARLPSRCRRTGRGSCSGSSSCRQSGSTSWSPATTRTVTVS